MPIFYYSEHKNLMEKKRKERERERERERAILIPSISVINKYCDGIAKN